MAEKDYYSILGLTEEDKKLHGREFEEKVSKAFKKLSLKWHPDRWVSGTPEEQKTAEEKFKEISEANSVLSDENKRAQYDNQGQNPFGDGGFNPFGGGFNPFGSGFNPFGGGFNPFGGQQNSGPVPEQGSDVEIEVKITLEEAYTGTTKKVEYYKDNECTHCHGTGSEDGKTHQCPHCNGTGFITKTTTRGNMIMQQSSPCPHCKGTGQLNTTPCKECNGSGVKKTKVEEEIPIPKGVDNELAMAYGNLGNAGKNGGGNGNLVVHFKIAPNSIFERKGNDLIYYDKVNFTEALLGYDKKIKCIDGKEVRLHVPECTKDGEKFVFSGKGMPSLDRYGRNGANGNLYVIVTYILPNKLSNKQRDKLKDFYGD